MSVKKIKTTKATKIPKVAKEKKVTRKRATKIAVTSTVPDSPFLSSTAHGHTILQADTVLAPKLDRRKHLTVVLGVSTIMTIIFIAWILNIRKIVSPDVVASPEPVNSAQEFADLKKELTSTLEEVKGKINELNTDTQQVPTSIVPPEISEEIRESFIKSLQTTTPTSTITPEVTPTLTTPPSTLP